MELDLELDQFTHAYMECALWASSDDNCDSLDESCDVDDISEPVRKAMIQDCQQFQKDNKELLEQAYQHGSYDAEHAGHDYWLTRNHHGAGFWDRGLGEVGDALTKAANAVGSLNLYVENGIVEMM